MEVTPGGGCREHDALDRPGRLASSLLRSFSVTSTPLRMHLVPPLLITSMSRIGSGHYKGRRARSESQHRSWPYGITGQICLVHEVVTAMGDGPARVLNIGAGHSPWVERQIGVRHRDFVSDRVDIDSPTVAEEHQHRPRGSVLDRAHRGDVETLRATRTVWPLPAMSWSTFTISKPRLGRFIASSVRKGSS